MAVRHEVTVPAHLRQYVAEQYYGDYTAIDHAVWRYVMQRNVSFLADKAHPAYIPGLNAAGIDVDTVPDVSRMNESLCKLGWGAVVVNGLIPSVAFFDFQAHGLLPISVDIRTLDHIEYTPAPDIIHEAAGHAPILYDEKYAEFVKVFGEIGSKALGTKEGHAVFDAVRNLTIVMENPFSTQHEIAEAQRLLAEKQAVRRKVSEESWLSRLYWWTVEYGLIGNLQNPSIYGAGLLSSVKEGRHCLTDAVQKLPFDLDACIGTRYDVTKPQPQLFVCESFDQLMSAVRELSQRMAYRVGGTESLVKALDSGRLATVVYSSGLQVSGTLQDVIKDENGDAVYVRTVGPSALSMDGQQLTGHGKESHRTGFASPIGRLEGCDKPLESCSDADLKRLQIALGEPARLSFSSGIKVEGTVRHVLRLHGRVALLSFTDCTVTYQNQTLFQPAWGVYDMAVGEQISSVFAGAADAESYFSEASDVPHLPVSNRAAATQLEQLYLDVQKLRSGCATTKATLERVQSVSETLDAHYPLDWLLRWELLELVLDCDGGGALANQLRAKLEGLRASHAELDELISNGLDLLRLPAAGSGSLT